LLGLKDPFDGWLAHQVEEEWEKLAPEMEAKQLIRKAEDGKVVVDDSIAGLIKTCCFPDSAVLVSLWDKSGHNANNCYYITSEMQVEKIDLNPTDKCSLNVLSEPSEVINLLDKYFPADEAYYSNSGGGELPSSVIDTLRNYKMNEYEEALALLQEKHPTFSDPARLVKALIDPVSYTIIIYSDFRKEQVKSYGFSVLKGQDSIWKLRSFTKAEQDWLEIKSLNKELFDQELHKISKKLMN